MWTGDELMSVVLGGQPKRGPAGRGRPSQESERRVKAALSGTESLHRSHPVNMDEQQQDIYGGMVMERSNRMEKDMARLPLSIAKCLLAAYLLTGGALLLLALLLYRLQLSEQIVSIGIIVIYVIAAFVCGFLNGKCAQDRRFLWGLLGGSLYFAILALITLVVNHGFQDMSTHFFTTLMICAGSGMLGGMVS